MATIGPLAHMQAERRAFWIMRAAPISVSGLLAAKAKAWSVVVGGTALLAYLVLSTGIPHPAAGEWIATGLAVVCGAMGVTWLGIALAAGAADLSDEQRPAIGPATIYRFMLVGGLYNVVLADGGAARVRGFLLYAFAIAAQWLAGVHQATVCLDAEAVRERRLTLADGAAFVVALALGRNAVAQMAEMFHANAQQMVFALGGLTAVIGLAATGYVARRPAARPRRGLPGSILLALGMGLAAAAIDRAMTRPAPIQLDAPVLAAQALGILVQEILFRGIVQRGAEDVIGQVPRLRRAAPALAAVVSVLLALISDGGLGLGVGELVLAHGTAALARAASGRLSAAVLARVAAVAAVLAMANIGR
jgi:hypothetical protein